MSSLLRSELFRLSRRRMPVVMLLILMALIALLYLLFWSVVHAPQRGSSASSLNDLHNSLRIGEVRSTGLGLVQQFGAVMVVILSASIIAAEYGWGTIRFLVPRSTGREPLITAKLISLLLYTIVIVLAGYLIAAVASTLVTAADGLDSSLGPDFTAHSLASLGRTIFAMLPYLAIAFVVALWTRSTAAGISVGLAVLFLEGIITGLIGNAGGVVKHLPELLLARNVQAVMHANSAGIANSVSSRNQTDLPNIWQATGVLALYTAVCVVLAYVRFRRADITSG